ncbi:hypothetical protein RB195_011836 [Necator americanus]|uniref:Uncharacterized protein n=1 Tax=Necator americanus TaxID=51031 RepID=A0ABR1D7F9_NECAM
MMEVAQKCLNLLARLGFVGSLPHVMYKVLERIIIDRLIKHREERKRHEQPDFRLGQYAIDQVFIVKKLIEIWSRYPRSLAFPNFESALESSLLNVLCADRVPGKFVRLLDDMNRRITDTVQTPARCTVA